MQFNFTVDKIQEVDKKILSDLMAIKRLLLKNVTNVRYLILVGGFGRGEGAVLFENGVPAPINDYDVVVISENGPDRSRLKELSKEIAKKIGVRLVDLIPIKNADVSSLPYTMFNYDMKYGGYIFFGDGNILGKMPDYDPSKMPLVEGKVLLFKRMICLLESYSEEFRKREPSEDEKFFLANQSSKMVVACCDSLLLLKGLYHHSYIERCKRFSEVFKERKKLVGLVQGATDFKLRPKSEINFDTIKYWFDARELFIDTLSEFLEFFYVRKFDDFEMFYKFYKKEGISPLRRIANIIRLKGTVGSRKNIELLELGLLYAINEESYVDGFLRLSRLELKKISSKKYPDNIGWELMRKECVRLWFKYLH